jgi:predicted transcriptional regulator
MPGPKGSLTAAQYEIMAAAWEAGSAGVTVADIWQAISRTRALGRTTVLNQVDRLEKRGWLRRVPGDGTTRFQPTISRDEASRQLVAGFVSDYFQGSGVELVSALLGNDALTLSRSDVGRLRKLLDQARRRRAGEEP